MLPNPRLNLVGSVFVTGFIPTRFAPLHVFFRTMDTGLGNFLWLSGQKRNEYNNHPVNNQMSWKTNYTCPQNVQAVINFKSRILLEAPSNSPTSVPFKEFLRSAEKLQGAHLFILPTLISSSCCTFPKMGKLIWLASPKQYSEINNA